MTTYRTQASVFASVLSMLVISSFAAGCAIPVPVETLPPSDRTEIEPVTGGVGAKEMDDPTIDMGKADLARRPDSDERMPAAQRLAGATALGALSAQKTTLASSASSACGLVTMVLALGIARRLLQAKRSDGDRASLAPCPA